MGVRIDIVGKLRDDAYGDDGRAFHTLPKLYCRVSVDLCPSALAVAAWCEVERRAAVGRDSVVW